MFWNGAALFAGMFSGAAFNMALVMINSQLFPIPEDLDPTDMAAMGTYIEGLPILALLIVLVAHVGQAFVGAGVGAVLARDKMVMAWIIGVLSMVFGIANLMMIPHPGWMWVEVPLYLAAAWAGGRLAIEYGPTFDDEAPAVGA